jgi:hypothetical protein
MGARMIAGTIGDTDQIALGLDPLPKKTCKKVFLDEMNQVVPWAELVALIQLHARGAHQALGGAAWMPVEATILRFRHLLRIREFGVRSQVWSPGTTVA